MRGKSKIAVVAAGMIAAVATSTVAVGHMLRRSTGHSRVYKAMTRHKTVGWSLFVPAIIPGIILE